MADRSARIAIKGDASGLLRELRRSSAAVAAFQKQLSKSGMMAAQTPSTAAQMAKSQQRYLDEQVKGAQKAHGKMAAASKASANTQATAMKRAVADAKAYVYQLQNTDRFLIHSRKEAEALARVGGGSYYQLSEKAGAFVAKSKEGVEQLIDTRKHAEELQRRGVAVYRPLDVGAEHAAAKAKAAAGQIQVLSSQTSSAHATMKNFSEETRLVGQSLSKAKLPEHSTQLGRISRASLAGAGAFSQLGRSIAYASGTFLAFAVLSGALRSSIAAAADFHQSLSRIVGLAGGARKQVEGFGNAILRLGPKVGVGPRELASALYFVASAGISAKHQMDVLTVSARGSAAGLGTTEVVADALTSAVNAYGEANLTASQSANVLADTVRYGKGEAQSFAPVIGTVASFAAALGVKFHEVGAALAAMTRLGIPAYTAAIELQAVFTNLLRPTQSATKAWHEFAQQSGVTADTFGKLLKQLKDQGLLATFKSIKQALGNDPFKLGQVFTNVRAVRGVLAIIGKSAGATFEIFRKMAGQSHALAVAFGAISKDPAYRFRALQATVESLEIAIGSALLPSVVKIGDALGAWLAKPGNIEKLNRSIQNMVQTMGTLAKAAWAVVSPLVALSKMASTLVGGWSNFFKIMIAGWALLHFRTKLFGDRLTADAKRQRIKRTNEVIEEFKDRQKAQIKNYQLQRQLRQKAAAEEKQAGTVPVSIIKGRGRAAFAQGPGGAMSMEALRNQLVGPGMFTRGGEPVTVRHPAGGGAPMMFGPHGLVSHKDVVNIGKGEFGLMHQGQLMKVRFIADTAGFNTTVKNMVTSTKKAIEPLKNATNTLVSPIDRAVKKTGEAAKGTKSLVDQWRAARDATKQATKAAEDAVIVVRKFRSGQLQAAAPGVAPKFISPGNIFQQGEGGPLVARAHHLGVPGNVTAPGTPPGGAQLMRVRIVSDPGPFVRTAQEFSTRLKTGVTNAATTLKSGVTNATNTLKAGLTSATNTLKGRRGIGGGLTGQFDPGPLRKAAQSIRSSMRSAAVATSAAFKLAFNIVRINAIKTAESMTVAFKIAAIEIASVMASALATIGFGLLIVGLTELLFNLKNIYHWLVNNTSAAKTMNDAMSGLNSNLVRTASLSKQLTQRKGTVVTNTDAALVAAENRLAAESAFKAARGEKARADAKAVLAQMVNREHQANKTLQQSQQAQYDVQEKLDQQANERPGLIAKTNEAITEQNYKLLDQINIIKNVGGSAHDQNVRIQKAVTATAEDLTKQAEHVTGFQKKVDLAMAAAVTALSRSLKPKELKIIVAMALKGDTATTIVRRLLGIGPTGEAARLRGMAGVEGLGQQGRGGATRTKPGEQLPFAPGDETSQFAISQSLLLKQAKAAASGSKAKIDAVNKEIIAWIRRTMHQFKFTDKQATDAFNAIAGLRSSSTTKTFAVKAGLLLNEAKASLTGSQSALLAAQIATRNWLQSVIKTGKHTKEWLTSAIQTLKQYNDDIAAAQTQLPLGLQLQQAKAYTKAQQLASARATRDFYQGLIDSGKLGTKGLIEAYTQRNAAKSQIKQLTQQIKKQFALPGYLQLAEAKASASGSQKQQEAVSKRITTWIRKQIAAGKFHGDQLVAAYNELGSRINKAVSNHADLVKQATDAITSAVDDAKGMIGDLFQGPILNPTEAQNQQVLGLKGPTIAGDTRDITAQTNQFLAWNKALDKLTRKGAPKGLIDELAKLGVAGMPNVQGLLAGTDKQLAKFFAQYKRREAAAQQYALIKLESKKVDLFAQSIVMNLTTRQLKQFEKTGVLPTTATAPGGMGGHTAPASVPSSIGSLVRHAVGGVTPGSGSGDTVPAMLTPGEVVFNRGHQKKLASRLGIAGAGPQSLFGFVKNLPGQVRGFAEGGVAGTKFEDLPNDEKMRRIVAGYSKGRLGWDKAVAALKFWGLSLPPGGPRGGPRLEKEHRSRVHYKDLPPGFGAAQQAMKITEDDRIRFYASQVHASKAETQASLNWFHSHSQDKSFLKFMDWAGYASMFIPGGRRGGAELPPPVKVGAAVKAAKAAVKLVRGSTNSYVGDLRPGQEIYHNGGWVTIRRTESLYGPKSAGTSPLGAPRNKMEYQGLKVYPEKGKPWTIPAKTRHVPVRSTQSGRAAPIAGVHGKGAGGALPGGDVLAENLTAGREIYRGGKWLPVHGVERTTKGIKVHTDKSPFTIPWNEKFVRVRPMASPQMMRLYRGEGKAVSGKNLPEWMKSTRGLWFTDDLKTAKRYGTVHYVDVPESAANQYATTHTVGAGREFIVPKTVAAQQKLLKEAVGRQPRVRDTGKSLVGGVTGRVRNRETVGEVRNEISFLKNMYGSLEAGIHDLMRRRRLAQSMGEESIASRLLARVKKSHTQQNAIKRQLTYLRKKELPAAEKAGVARAVAAAPKTKVGRIKAALDAFDARVFALERMKNLITDSGWQPPYASSAQGPGSPQFKAAGVLRGEVRELGRRFNFKGIERLRDNEGATVASNRVQGMINDWLATRNAFVEKNIYGKSLATGKYGEGGLSAAEQTQLKRLYAAEGGEFQRYVSTKGRVPYKGQSVAEAKAAKKAEVARVKKKMKAPRVMSEQWRTLANGQMGWLGWRRLKEGEKVVSYHPNERPKITHTGTVSEVGGDYLNVNWDDVGLVRVTEPWKSVRRPKQLEPPGGLKKKAAAAVKKVQESIENVPRPHFKYASEFEPGWQLKHNRRYEEIYRVSQHKDKAGGVNEIMVQLRSREKGVPGEKLFFQSHPPRNRPDNVLPLGDKYMVRYAHGGVVPSMMARLGLGMAMGGIVKPRMMAAGGIVTKPTFAMIGEKGAEAVIPLGKGGPVPKSKLLGLNDSSSSFSEASSGTVNMTAKTVNIKPTGGSTFTFAPEINVYVDGVKSQKVKVQSSANQRRGGSKGSGVPSTIGY